MGLSLDFVRLVGVAGGWLFLVWIAVGLRREAKRQRAIAAAPRTVQAGGGVLGLCGKCKRPKLPPGVRAPDYLNACDCPTPTAAAALEGGRPPRPIT